MRKLLRNSGSREHGRTRLGILHMPRTSHRRGGGLAYRLDWYVEVDLDHVRSEAARFCMKNPKMSSLSKHHGIQAVETVKVSQDIGCGS